MRLKSGRQAIHLPSDTGRIDFRHLPFVNLSCIDPIERQVKVQDFDYRLNLFSSYAKDVKTPEGLYEAIDKLGPLPRYWSICVNNKQEYDIYDFESAKKEAQAVYEFARRIAINLRKSKKIQTPLPPPQTEDPFLDISTIKEWCIDVSQKQPTNSGKAGDEKTTNGKTELSKVPTLELLKQGESHTLEFKEIPECNTRQNRKNNDVLFPSLKTMAGFLNAEGGILFIGVDNSGKIAGIEPYLNTMAQGNNDTFEQQIRNCLRDRFEPQPIGKVKVSFDKFTEGTVCRIDVQANKEPVHLDDKVYVRDGNTTQLLKGRRLTDWIQQRRVLTALPSGK